MEKFDLLRDTYKALPDSKRAARQHVSSDTPLDVYRLNYNENPYGPSPKVIETIKENLQFANLYPDWFSIGLKHDLADLYGLTIDNFCVASGSSAVIEMTGHVFLEQKDEVVLGDPSYESFRDTAYACGAKVVTVPMKDDMGYDLEGMLAAVTPKTKILVICNPNNPTGTFISSAKMEEFIKKIPDHVVTIIDEAYLEFVSDDGTYSMLELLKQKDFDKPLLVLKTFSKAYGMAGMRVGYAIGCPEMIDLLNKSGIAWNNNILGQRAARSAIKDQEYIRDIAAKNAAERTRLTAELKALGCTVYESKTNFILYKSSADPALVAKTMKENKILIGAPCGCNRVSIGMPEANDKFLAIMKEILKK